MLVVTTERHVGAIVATDLFAKMSAIATLSNLLILFLLDHGLDWLGLHHGFERRVARIAWDVADRMLVVTAEHHVGAIVATDLFAKMSAVATLANLLILFPLDHGLDWLCLHHGFERRMARIVWDIADWML